MCDIRQNHSATANRRCGRLARLRPGAEAEYDRLHAAVWPEVLAAITQAGIRNYSIFRHGSLLFSYFEVPADFDLAAITQTLRVDAACARWEKLITPLREPAADSPDNPPWEPMAEIFHQA